MLPASLAACVPLFIATATSACASAGRVVGAVAGHRDQVALRLVVADHRELVLGRGLGEEVVDAGLGRDRGRGERVVAGDHHGPDAHRGASRRSARLMPPFTMSLSCTTPSTRSPSATTSGVAPCFATSSTVARHVGRHSRARAASTIASRSRRPRPCGSGARRSRRRSCASARVNGTKVAPSACTSRPRRPNFSFASTTMLRPSGVSSASEASCAASASSRLGDAAAREGTRSPGGCRA